MPLPAHYRDVRFQFVLFGADPAAVARLLPDPLEADPAGRCAALGIRLPYRPGRAPPGRGGPVASQPLGRPPPPPPAPPSAREPQAGEGAPYQPPRPCRWRAPS